MGVTAPIAALRGAVFAAFPTTRNGGDDVCKKIEGTDTWSQHSWGNALDIMVPDLPTGDRVKAWLLARKSSYGLGTILWRVARHYDHVHVEGSPKQVGVPPCAGGKPGLQKAPGGMGLIDTIAGAIGAGTGLPGIITGLLGGGTALRDFGFRIVYGAAGVILIGFGLNQMAKEFGLPSVPSPTEVKNLVVKAVA